MDFLANFTNFAVVQKNSNETRVAFWRKPNTSGKVETNDTLIKKKT